MASRYFVNGGVDNNWGTTGNWSTVSGGAGGSSVPSSADDVFLDGNSPNCVVNTTTRSAKTLTCTGYVNTLTMNANLEISGSVTIVSGMTFSGSSTLVAIATGTWTSNGKTVNVPVQFRSSMTITMADDLTCSALFRVGGNSGENVTVNGNKIFAGAGFTITNDTMFGTTELVLSGTGTYTGGTNASVRNNLTFDASGGTITISGTLGKSTNTFKYTSGTVVTSGSTFKLAGSTTTLDLNGITWDAVTFASSSTATMTSGLQCTGLLSFLGSGETYSFSGTITAGGGVTIGSSVNVNGAGTLLLNGTGTVTVTSATSSFIPNITVNTAGTITFNGLPGRAGTGKLTLTAGTIAGTALEVTIGSGGGGATPFGFAFA